MSAEDRYGEVLAIVRASLDPTTAALIADALGDADRLSVIRDLFLAGRDLEAVKELRDIDPVGIRRLLPVSASIQILPLQSAQITARPQMPFTATHLFVSRACAPVFMINDIVVGRRSQFVQAGDVPADMFAVDMPVISTDAPDEHGFVTWSVSKIAETWMTPPMDLPEVMPGMDIMMVVTNVGDVPISFSGAWHGKVRGY